MDSIGSKPAETQGVSRKLCLACNRQFEDAGMSHCPHDSTQLVNLGRDETTAWLGKTISNKYKVLEAVGKGGMGTVFKAEQLGLGRHVAIKMLKAQLSEDKVSVKRFEQEATASATLQHPNLITLFDFGMIDDKQPYLVMEFLEGESLAMIIREHGCVNPVRCLRIFAQVMEGLTAAHLKGVVHRDIKPSNIILVKNEKELDVVKVVDFGLAKLMPWSGKESQHLTKTGEVFGSPIYMSPEQCQGKKLEQTSDIYSVGVTIYEALTGKPPFKGRNVVETASMHISSQPPPFEMTRPDLRLSNKLQAVIFKSLDKDPYRRFLTMDEFRKALTDAISGSGSNEGFRSENEAAELPNEATQPVKKTDVDNYRAPKLTTQRQLEQRQEEKRRKITIIAATLCIVLVLACAGVFVYAIMQKPSGGTSLTANGTAEATGIVWYLDLEAAPAKGEHEKHYTIKEVHLMAKPRDATAPSIVKFTGNLTPRVKFYQNLRLGENWTCKAQNGSLSDVVPQKEGAQEQINGAWNCLVEFISAVNKSSWEKTARMTDDFHGGEGTRSDKDAIKRSWQAFKLKKGAINLSQEFDVATGDPYAEKPLPQCVKVAMSDSETVQLLLDKSVVFTKNGQPIPERLIQRFTLTSSADGWKISIIGPENDDKSTADWDKY